MEGYAVAGVGRPPMEPGVRGAAPGVTGIGGRRDDRSPV